MDKGPAPGLEDNQAEFSIQWLREHNLNIVA